MYPLSPKLPKNVQRTKELAVQIPCDLGVDIGCRNIGGAHKETGEGAAGGGRKGRL